MNYVISIINPDALPVLAEICQAQSLHVTGAKQVRDSEVRSMRVVPSNNSYK